MKPESAHARPAAALATPRISVITAVLNGVRHLEQNILSLQSQRGIEVEHLIVDGGSTDGTLEIINRHAEKFAWWFSGPDKGIGDAMNKGIARARGEWLLFLHSDDVLASADSLASAQPQLGDEADIVSCAIMFGDGPAARLIRPRAPGFRLNFKTGLPHQGTFIRRTLFDEIGAFDERYKIVVDYEFFLRAHRQDIRVKLCSEICLSRMDERGISSRQDWYNLRMRLLEEKAVHAQHCRSTGMKWLYGAYWSAYLPYRRLRAALIQRQVIT